jgi:pimeloyl-ACP methyl ester carboxylesterase
MTSPTLLTQVLGIGLAVGGARYYFTHPRRVIADLPRDLDQVSEKVFLRAEDTAQLCGTWLRAAPGKPGGFPRERTIIHHHGFNSSSGMLLARKPEPLTAWPLVREALRHGYNFLLVDARAHGRSDGPWDSKGVLVGKDLMGWVRWLRLAQDQLWVGLWGNSLGSTVGLNLAVRPAGGGLDAMVLDSPAISGKGLYSGLIRKPAYWVVQPVIEQLAGENLYEFVGARNETGVDADPADPWHG